MDESGFNTALVGRVLVARALGSITVAGITTVLQKVAAVRRQIGEPILYWPILDPTADVPPPEVRNVMRDATETLLRSCESMTLIVPGSAMKASLLRAFMRGFIRLGGHASKVRVVDSLAAAVAAANDSSIRHSEILAAASAAGIAMGAAPDQSAAAPP